MTNHLCPNCHQPGPHLLPRVDDAPRKYNCRPAATGGEVDLSLEVLAAFDVDEIAGAIIEMIGTLKLLGAHTIFHEDVIRAVRRFDRPDLRSALTARLYHGLGTPVYRERDTLRERLQGTCSDCNTLGGTCGRHLGEFLLGNNPVAKADGGGAYNPACADCRALGVSCGYHLAAEGGVR